MLDGSINPLNAYQVRRVKQCPPHFTTIVFKCPDQESVTEWVYENLQGRFYLGSDNESHASIIELLTGEQYKIGFEIAQEATIFGLNLGRFLK